MVSRKCPNTQPVPKSAKEKLAKHWTALHAARYQVLSGAPLRVESKSDAAQPATVPRPASPPPKFTLSYDDFLS